METNPLLATCRWRTGRTNRERLTDNARKRGDRCRRKWKLKWKLHPLVRAPLTEWVCWSYAIPWYLEQSHILIINRLDWRHKIPICGQIFPFQISFRCQTPIPTLPLPTNLIMVPMYPPSPAPVPSTMRARSHSYCTHGALESCLLTGSPQFQAKQHGGRHEVQCFLGLEFWPVVWIAAKKNGRRFEENTLASLEKSFSTSTLTGERTRA